MAIEWQVAPVHAAPHAAIHAFFQSADLAFASAILGKLTPYANQRNRIGLGPGAKMAALAIEIVAAIALARVGGGRADLVRGVDHQGVAIFDELAEGIIADAANGGRRPFGKIDPSALRPSGGRRWQERSQPPRK